MSDFSFCFFNIISTYQANRTNTAQWNKKSVHQNSEYHPTISIKIIRSAYYQKSNKAPHQNSVDQSIVLHLQRCIKFPAIWYSSPSSFLENLIFSPKLQDFPSSPLDNLTYSLNIKGQMIFLPLTLFFSVWYSTQKPLNYLTLSSLLEILPQRIW